MRVFLLHATATRSLGFRIGRKLLATGHQVTGLANSPKGIANLTAGGMEAVFGDLGAPEVQKQLAQADGIIDDGFPAGDEQVAAAPARRAILIQSLIGTGKPLIVASNIALLGDTGPIPVGEDAPLKTPPSFIWLPPLDQMVLDAPGVRGVVIRSAFKFGVTGDFVIQSLISLARRFKQGRYVGSGTNRWSAVHIDDLADLYCLALIDTRAKGVLHAAAETFSMQELVGAIHRGLGFEGEPAGLSLEEAKKITPMAEGLMRNAAVSGDLARSLGWLPSRQSMLQEVESLAVQSRIGAEQRERAPAKPNYVKPELKQFGDLSATDFERHPVWIGVHNADYGEPWYDETNEETFRPYAGSLPAAPDEGILLVRATFELKDGSQFPGFVTPASEDWDRPREGHSSGKRKHILGFQQPRIFVGNEGFNFWGGISGVRDERRQALYAALQKTPQDIFPLRFSAEPSLAGGILAGEVEGFYRNSRKQGLEIEQ